MNPPEMSPYVAICGYVTPAFPLTSTGLLPFVRLSGRKGFKAATYNLH